MTDLAAIERVPRATFREHIVERLRAAILDGDLPPGSPLVETALASRFSVSRAPLREALRQLIEQGLVRPYAGHDDHLHIRYCVTGFADPNYRC